MKGRSFEYYLLAAGLLLILGLAVYQARTAREKGSVDITGSANAKKAEQVHFLNKGAFPSFVSGVMEPGNIRLELSPEGFEEDRFRVRYFANAHDMTLDSFDLAAMTTLQFGDRVLKPTRADRMKGHHDSGLIFFDLGAIHDPEEMTTFVITVRGLPREESRTYRWE